MFAAAVTAGLRSVGCDVIDIGLVPTPTVQLAVEHHRSGGGIAITASHNPIEWNALKFIGPDGIFLDGIDGARVQKLVAEDGQGQGGTGKVTRDEGAVERHLDAVLRLPAVDVERIRKRKFTVALDAVRGAGGPVMRTLLERLGCEVAGINLETDGHFPRAPEPIPENLGGLSTLVTRAGAALGLAVDPDVDRLAIVDETATPIGEDYTLAFAVRAVLGGPADGGTGGRKTQSPVVCNLSTSLVVEDAARECGAEVVRTPVGEVHVARTLVRLGAAIGGEGNGGVMYPPLHAGRDAPVAAALLLTLLARDGKRVSELVAAAPRYAIVKAKAARGPALEPVYAALRRRFADAQVDTQDGLRLAWRERWLHVRPSNTEPIIRLIAEAPSRAAAEQLVEEGRRLCAAS
jgi:phosphomannomutase